MTKKKNSINKDSLVLIVIFAIVAIFVFGLKPLYQMFEKLQNGTLFEKEIIENKDKEEKKEEEYKIIKPIGESKLLCTQSVSNEGGTQKIDLTLYHTNNRLKSIKMDRDYSGFNDEYSNYILSEQNKFKERKTNNLSNKGYSIDIKLESTTELEVSEVFNLETTDLDKVSKDINMKGTYNQDIYEIANEYIKDGYVCKW